MYSGGGWPGDRSAGYCLRDRSEMEESAAVRRGLRLLLDLLEGIIIRTAFVAVGGSTRRQLWLSLKVGRRAKEAGAHGRCGSADAKQC